MTESNAERYHLRNPKTEARAWLEAMELATSDADDPAAHTAALAAIAHGIMALSNEVAALRRAVAQSPGFSSEEGDTLPAA